MSLANEASLLLIPSGYKSGIVYSVFPTDGDGDFTFSRVDPGTRVGAGGLIETMSSNIPRLDYSNGDCPILLLEPQRTNLVQYSEDFNSWGDSGITVTSNALISPSGDLTADKLQSTANNWRKSDAYTVTNGAEYSVSIYAKLDTSTSTTSTRIEIYRGVNAIASTFNLSTGAISGSISNTFIENVGNDWYRIGGTYISNGSTNIFYIYPSSGYSNAGTMFFWGAQVEQGSYPTSYIKTTGSIVTRQKDFIDGAGSSDLFNSLESTFFVQMASFLNAQTNSNGIELAGVNGQNRITLQYDTINNQIRCDVRVLNSAQAIITTQSFDITNFNKMAITYKLNEVKFYVNGQLISTDTSVNLFAPNTLTEVRSTIADISGGAFNLQAKIKDLRVYNRALTQAESIQLTTL